MSDDSPRRQWRIENAGTDQAGNMIPRDEPFGFMPAIFGKPLRWNVLPVRVGDPLKDDE